MKLVQFVKTLKMFNDKYQISLQYYYSLVDAAPRILNPIRRLMQRHSDEFGRHLCVRMDYVSLNPTEALNIFETLQIKIRSPIVFVHAWFHYGAHSFQVSGGICEITSWICDGLNHNPCGIHSILKRV